MTVTAGMAAASPSHRRWRRAAVVAAAVCTTLSSVLGAATSAAAEVPGGTGEIRNASSGRHIGTYGNYGQVLAAFTDADWPASSDRSWTFTPREHGRYYSIQSTTKGTCWTRSQKPAVGGDWDRYGPWVVTLASCSPTATNQQFQLWSEPYPAPHGTVSIRPRDDISTVLRQTSIPLGDGGTWNALSLETPQHTDDEFWTVPVAPNVGW